MTTVETRVVNPVSNPTTMDPVNVPESVETQEDKILVDEEIRSCEAEGEDVENQMLTAALVNSVVDSGKPEDNPQRYGLRKRRRPGDPPSPGARKASDAAAVTPDGDVSSNPAKKTMLQKPLLQPPKKEPPGTAVKTPVMPKPVPTSTIAVKQEALKPGPRIGVITEDRINQGLQSIHAQLKIKQAPPQQVRSRNPVPVAPASTAVPKAHRKPVTTSQPRLQPAAPRSRLIKPNSAAAINQQNRLTPAVKPALVPTSGAVPNPLLHSTPPPAVAPSRPYTSSRPGPERAVQCEIPAPVPCPLKPETREFSCDKKVTISEPSAPAARGRIFSVDLDPATFDFSDMGANSDEKVDHSVIAGEIPNLSRDRAFSFDFFNFAGDDLLPAIPDPHPTSSELPDPACASDTELPPVKTRPRGESIIFDPISFQDGGIHEKNALLKVRASRESAPALLADSRLATGPTRPEPVPKTGPPSSVTPNPLPAYSSGPPREIATPAASSGQMATLPSALTAGNASGSTPATFQMELLNKDGRIGIYLPEARKARIARFHAKRKMRIWRKRIKYDCRKKLADSRPRIKGRFVKRSDMEED